MRAVPDGKRAARYRSVIALYDPTNDKIRFARGVAEGAITFGPQGDNGFGYDPVFMSNDLGKTFGESTLKDVTSVSHRGRPLKKAREILLAEFI